MVDPELDELRREFLAEAAAKVREIQGSVENGRSPDSIERLTYLAHQLKGSGGSYGFERISAEAAELEKAAERLGGGESDEDLSRKLREHAGNLQNEIETRRKELGEPALG
jgi:HPt (histidine-containing phosphotransfer) domain-containing protein